MTRILLVGLLLMLTMWVLSASWGHAQQIWNAQPNYYPNSPVTLPSPTPAYSGPFQVIAPDLHCRRHEIPTLTLGACRSDFKELKTTPGAKDACFARWVCQPPIGGPLK